MAVKYIRLWELLLDKGMKKTDLKTEAGISSNVLAKLGKDEYVSMETMEKLCTSLDCNIEDIMEFNPGDILVFNTDEHIAMTSDKRNANGIPYLIQNRDETQTEKEEDRLEETEMEITSHYRFTYNDNLEKLINSIKE